MVSTIGSRRALFGALFFALLCTFALQHGNALAHAKFVSGTPGPGDVLAAAPAQIDAYFAEDIVRQQGTYGLAVYDAHGSQVDNQDTVLDDYNRRHMTVTLQGGLSAGDYTVKWWTVSDEDGDAATDTYTFTISGS